MAEGYAKQVAADQEVHKNFPGFRFWPHGKQLKVVPERSHVEQQHIHHECWLNYWDGGLAEHPQSME
jgi:hypothetical protein